MNRLDLEQFAQKGKNSGYGCSPNVPGWFHALSLPLFSLATSRSLGNEHAFYRIPTSAQNIQALEFQAFRSATSVNSVYTSIPLDDGRMKRSLVLVEDASIDIVPVLPRPVQQAEGPTTRQKKLKVNNSGLTNNSSFISGHTKWRAADRK